MIKPIFKTILTSMFIQINNIQLLFAYKIIISNHNTANRSQQTGVSNQPGKNISIWVSDQFPGKYQNSQYAGDISTFSKVNFFWR